MDRRNSLLIWRQNQIRTGKSKLKFPCLMCDSKFKTKANYQRHLKENHDYKKAILCMVCQDPFQSLEELKEHLKNNHEIFSIFHCEICNQVFRSSSAKSAHKRKIHGFGALCSTSSSKRNRNPKSKTVRKRSLVMNFNENDNVETQQNHQDQPQNDDISDVQGDIVQDSERSSPNANFPFTFDSEKCVTIKKEIKQEFQNDDSSHIELCNNIKTEDQSEEIRRLNQMIVDLTEKFEQSQLKIASLEGEIHSLNHKMSLLADIQK